MHRRRSSQERPIVPAGNAVKEGARPLAALFRRACQPLATAATPGAILFGRRLVAVDAAAVDLPGTAANTRAFGRPAVRAVASGRPFWRSWSATRSTIWPGRTTGPSAGPSRPLGA